MRNHEAQYEHFDFLIMSAKGSDHVINAETGRVQVHAAQVEQEPTSCAHLQLTSPRYDLEQSTEWHHVSLFCVFLCTTPS